MKKNILSLVSMVIMLVLVSPAINAQAGKTDFSGTWAFNAEKSNFGQGGAQGGGGQRFGGGNMVVKQEGNILTTETTRPGRDGGNPVTTTTRYTLDGKESVNTTQRGESKSTATWSADGKTLSIVTSRTFNMNGESRTMQSTEEWALPAAGTLSIKTSMSTPNGERTTTRVYGKK